MNKRETRPREQGKRIDKAQVNPKVVDNEACKNERSVDEGTEEMVRGQQKGRLGGGGTWNNTGNLTVNYGILCAWQRFSRIDTHSTVYGVRRVLEYCLCASLNFL